MPAIRLSPASARCSADDDRGRVHDVDEGRDDLADVAPGLPHHLAGSNVSATHQIHDVLTGLGRDAQVAQVPRQRRCGRDGFEAAPGCRIGR